MMTILEILQKIREQPGMMLGRKSARSLSSFLSGFAYAREDAGLDDFGLLPGFGDFLRKRYEISSSQNWVRIIEYYSVTEANELPLFWKLWDEYLEEAQPRSCQGRTSP
jgi:hypothetical protein